MSLTNEEYKVYEVFLNRVVAKLSEEEVYEIVNRWKEEVGLKDERAAFIQRLVKGGMAREAAEEAVINFQRKAGSADLGKKLLLKKAKPTGEKKEMKVQTSSILPDTHESGNGHKPVQLTDDDFLG